MRVISGYAKFFFICSWLKNYRETILFLIFKFQKTLITVCKNSLEESENKEAGCCL